MIHGNYFSWLPVQSGVPKGLSLAHNYLFYIIMTFTLLFVILNMVTMFSDDLSIYKDVSQQLTVPSYNSILMALFTDLCDGIFN